MSHISGLIYEANFRWQSVHIGIMTEDLWAQYMLQVGDNLARWREQKNLSQEDVAIRAGIVRYTYQRLERGLKHTGDLDTPANPTFLTLVSVLNALDQPLSALPQPAPEIRSRD